MMTRRSIIFSIFLLIFSSSSFSQDWAKQLKQERDAYIETLNSATGYQLAKHADKITSSGLSDKLLFDSVKTVLLQKHEQQMTTAPKDDLVVHQVVTLLRTLASAGKSDYISILNRILRESSNRAIRNRAKHVMKKIGFYHDRNQIMQNLDTHSARQSLHTTRSFNLLKSDDLIMSRFAAEEIVRANKAAPIIQEWLADRLKQQSRQTNDKLHADTLAWYCKVLGTVNMSKYQGFIRELSKDRSVHSQIRKHARKILR